MCDDDKKGKKIIRANINDIYTFKRINCPFSLSHVIISIRNVKSGVQRFYL